VAFALVLSCLRNVVGARHDEVSEDNLHYALHAVHPHFKDGVFTSNQQAMEVLERQDRLLASRIYALAKRQSNSTVTTSKAAPAPAPPAASPDSSTPAETPKTPAATQNTPVETPNTPVATGNVAPSETPNTPIETPTTPFVTTSTSQYETVLTSPNGVRSTRTTFAIVVETVTPSQPQGTVESNPDQTTSGNASLQSLSGRARETPTTVMMLLLIADIIIGCLWVGL